MPLQYLGYPGTSMLGSLDELKVYDRDLSDEEIITESLRSLGIASVVEVETDLDPLLVLLTDDEPAEAFDGEFFYLKKSTYDADPQSIDELIRSVSP